MEPKTKPSTDRFPHMLVQASSVADYLDRYYRPERRTETLLDTYEEEFRREGRVCTSHHDNVTGRFIYWPTAPEWLRA